MSPRTAYTVNGATSRAAAATPAAPPASRAERARADFARRSALLRERLCQDDFLHNRGLGNEIGFFTFCYDPSLELEARALFEDLERDSEAGRIPARLKIVNLYDLMLEVLEERRILKAIPRQELKRGSDWLADNLGTKSFSAQRAAEAILERTAPFEPGDVILVTGVGEAYPVLRAHDLLNNMLADFGEVPVVIAFPGTFDGQQFRLFGRLPADNYYRAFDIS